MDKLISIIIPVYNVKEYLSKCVKSVINQTYTNCEIFLIDDGSTDGSGELCDKLAKQDERIIVLHKKNGGLSDARNVALDMMCGEYVVCVDSDDYVTEDYIEYLYGLVSVNNADIAVCQFKKIYNTQDRLDDYKEKIEVLDKASAIENYLYQRKFTASAHCKIYKSELFAEIRYPVGYYYEDMAIICKLLDRSSKIIVSNLQKYYYVQRNGSIMAENFNLKKMQRIEISQNIRNFIIEKYPEFVRAADARCLLAAAQTFREIPFAKENNTYLMPCWKQICLYRRKVFLDRKAKKYIRLMAFSSLFGKRFLSTLGNLYYDSSDNIIHTLASKIVPTFNAEK